MAITKIQYGAAQTLAISLASLASSTTFVAGRQSTVVDNSSNRYIDALISGYVRGDASLAPTTFGLMANLYVFTQDGDGPLYPTYDGLTRMGATDAALTFSSVDQRANACRHASSAVWGAATANLIQTFPPVSVASLFGGVMPKRWGVFLAQNTGRALHATAGEHVLQWIPITLETV